MSCKIPEEIYKKAILKWKSLHPEQFYLNIPTKEVIEVEGFGKVNIGRKINNMRTGFKKIQNKEYSSKSTSLTKDQFIWYTKHGMIWDYVKWQKEVFHMAALQWKKKHPEEKYLNIPQNEVIFIKGIGLVNIGHKINSLRTIYKEMQEGKSTGTHKRLSPEEILWWTNQGMIWIYQKRQKKNVDKSYKRKLMLLLVFLQEFNLNLYTISKYINQHKNPIEESIKKAILSQYKKDNNHITERIYSDLIQAIDIKKSKNELEEELSRNKQFIIDVYGISEKEYNIVTQTFLKYATTIRTYQIYEVGLETNYQEKIKKIEKYNLTREEIEESLLVPLEFKDKQLLDPKSEIYSHRQIIRQYVIDWNEYTDEEKIEVIKQNKFSQSEVLYIENTREKINQTLHIVQSLRRKTNHYIKSQKIKY